MQDALELFVDNLLKRIHLSTSRNSQLAENCRSFKFIRKIQSK